MSSGSRPAVSVIVPFLGDAAAAAATLDRLAALEARPGDELIVADNTAAGEMPERDGVTVVRAGERRSSYFARNAGAATASAPWLLFLDADCRPTADLIERLFDPEPEPRCAIVAGEVVGDPSQSALTARWARSRRQLIASHHLDAGPAPAGVTANLLVRRDAFEAVGGFDAGVRSTADLDVCWRIQERDGWTLEYRPGAVVLHRDPERLHQVVRQAARYGAGRRWLARNHGDALAPPPLGVPLARALGGALAWTLALRFERAAFKLLDGASAAAMWWGYERRSNDAEASDG
jgi:GT2 family glycosyltransferase